MKTKAFHVAAWEFLEKVKSRTFLVSLVIMPIIIIFLGVVPTFLASSSDVNITVIGIIDVNGDFIIPLNLRLAEKYRLPDGQSNYVLRKIKWQGDFETTIKGANELLEKGEIEGYFYFPSNIIDSGKVEYRARNVGNIKIQERFSRAIEEIIIERRIIREGIDPAVIRKLTMDVNITPIKVSAEGEEKEAGFLEIFFSGYVVIMILVYLILTSGQMLVRSMVEEKSNRLVEVLLSSCSAQDLMIGKIVGLSGLGILQVTIWGLISLAVALKTGTGLNLFAFENIALSIVYFVLGYIFYAAVFVTAGSPVTTEHEAQHITSYLTLLLVFPLIISIMVIQAPDALFVKILSFVPFLTPTLMVLRLNVQMPASWEIIGTIALLFVSSSFMMCVAGRVFRIAILSYGKKPSLPELIKWIRET